MYEENFKKIYAACKLMENSAKNVTIHRFQFSRKFTDNFQNIIAPRIHVKIAVNAVNARNLVQMSLLSCRSKIGLGAFRKFSPFVCMAIWLL